MEEKSTPVQKVPQPVEDQQVQASLSDIQPPPPSASTPSQTVGPIIPEVLPPTRKGSPIIWIVLIVLISLLGVGGYLSINSRNSINKIAETIPNTTETPTADPTVNWKTHISTALGFTLKYPAEYNPPEERENYLSLISPLNPNRGKGYDLQNGELKIEIVTEAAKENDSSIKCLDDHNSDNSKIISQSETTISGINTTIFASEELGTGQFICIIYNKQRYLINKYPFETTRQTEFNQILSTFKFTD